MKKRNSGIELLRIFLMLCIIWGHLFAHSEIQSKFHVFSERWIIAYSSQSLTSCAVNCFIIISGYYMTESSFSWEKFLRLWKKVFSYSVFIYLLLVVLGCAEPSIDGCINAFFPVLRVKYWFFTSYLLLYLLSPYIKQGLCSLSDAEYQKLAIIIVIFFYILPIFAIVFPPIDPSLGYGIIGMVTLYILGGYIRRMEINISYKKCSFFLLINNCIVFGSKIVLTWLAGKLDLEVGTSLLYRYNTFFQLINAILLLILFKQINLSRKMENFVYSVSGSVFSVYLIHEQSNIRELLWKNKSILNLLNTTNLVEFIVSCICITFTVFVICVLLDKMCFYLAQYVRKQQIQMRK